MPTVDQIFPQTIVAENPYTTQPKSLSKNCVKQEERTSLTPRIEILLASIFLAIRRLSQRLILPIRTTNVPTSG